MIYYFDVIETYVKTVGVEAEDLNQATYRVEELYRSKDISIDTLPNDIEFAYIQDEVEDIIATGYITPDEIETFTLN